MARPPIKQVQDPFDPTLEITLDQVNGEDRARAYFVAITDRAFEARDASKSAPRDRILIATVTKRRFETYPIHVRRLARDYLKPKYGTLTTISFVDAGGGWLIPTDTLEFEELLSHLPIGFARQFQFGLGMKWEYRFLPHAISEIDGVSELAVVDGIEAAVNLPTYRLGEHLFTRLRRSIDRISRDHQREALESKLLLSYSNLLRRVLPDQFPLRTRKVRPGKLYELVQLGERATLAKTDQKAAVALVKSHSKEIAESEPAALLELRADIERITLAVLIEKIEDMLGKDLGEPAWQAFLKANPFVLSLAFAYPVFLIQDQAFVGGTTLRGVGEKIADFLLAQRYSGNLALIEIKKPGTSLLSSVPYREGLHSASKELSGALAQVLDQRYRLNTSFIQKAYESGLKDVHPYTIQCVVVAGRTPAAKEELKSLELFRNASKDVSVITFDELLEKLREIQRVFTANSAEGDDQIEAESPSVSEASGLFEEH